jgi:hypothetical protein
MDLFNENPAMTPADIKNALNEAWRLHCEELKGLAC